VRRKSAASSPGNSIIQQIASGEIVAAVGDEIVSGHQLGGIGDVETRLMRLDLDVGLMAAMAAAALATLNLPRLFVVWMTWRWRLDSSTRSSSMMPIVPTPAAARYCNRGEPGPRSHHQHAARQQAHLTLLAHLVQDHVPA